MGPAEILVWGGGENAKRSHVRTIKGHHKEKRVTAIDELQCLHPHTLSPPPHIITPPSLLPPPPQCHPPPQTHTLLLSPLPPPHIVTPTPYHPSPPTPPSNNNKKYNEFLIKWLCN